MEKTGLFKNSFRKGISPIRILPLGFLAIIIVGTLLLMLPSATVAPGSLPFIDALFTATSASCVTGLIVLDTGTELTMLGQVIVLLLIQTGGLGFMAIMSVIFSAGTRSISLRQRMAIAEALGEDRLQGVVRLGRSVVKLTLFCELIGALLLSIRFIPQFGIGRGLWVSVFTSISAFCNAGFDLMGNYASLTAYSADPLVILTVCALIIAGGLGFAVVMDIGRLQRGNRGLRMHSKVVLASYAVLTFGGAALFLLFEYGNPQTMADMGIGEKLLSALFQSVTCRTAGFNSIDQAGMMDASKLLSSVLMLIGGAPAGTAGGMKVTTIAVMVLATRALIRHRDDAEAYGRRIPSGAVRRALCIFLIAIAVLLGSVMAMSAIEQSAPVTFLDQLYEVASALGTVGLSAGVTAACHPASRCILIALMYIGRVGIITLVLALGKGATDSSARYPEGDLMVG